MALIQQSGQPCWMTGDPSISLFVFKRETYVANSFIDIKMNMLKNIRRRLRSFCQMILKKFTLTKARTLALSTKTI